jgi:sodium-dependent dicarboxylate transporter 2/3/5
MGKRLGLPNNFIIVLLLTFITLILPNPPGLPPSGQRSLAALVFTGTIFALQPVPLPFAGLMVHILLAALGLTGAETAFETLSRPIIILILGSLFLAEALRKYGITRRLALQSIVLSGGGINKLLFGLMGIAALLSMWMENTATAAILIPVALTITNQITEKEEADKLLIMLVLGIAYAASVGGMATITGSASNAVASEFLSEIRFWTFLEWMKYGVPSLIVVFPITWYIVIKQFKLKIKKIDIEKSRNDLTNLGKMETTEIEILIILVLTIILWVSGSFFEESLGLPPSFLSPAIVGLISVSYLALRGIIAWEDVRGVSWGLFFSITAGLALGDALKRSGATGWLMEVISPIIRGSPYIVNLFILVFASLILTNIINNATVAAVFVPILIQIAATDPSFKTIQLVLPLTMGTTFGYALPSASGRMALISETGLISPWDMFKYGMVVSIISALSLIALFYTLALLNLI